MPLISACADISGNKLLVHPDMCVQICFFVWISGGCGFCISRYRKGEKSFPPFDIKGENVANVLFRSLFCENSPFFLRKISFFSWEIQILSLDFLRENFFVDLIFVFLRNILSMTIINTKLRIRSGVLQQVSLQIMKRQRRC